MSRSSTRDDTRHSGVIDLRPGDANETGYAWIAALEHKHQPARSC